MFTVCVARLLHRQRHIDQLLMSSISRVRAQHQRPDPSSEPSAPTQPLNLKGAPADEDLQTKVINKRLGGGLQTAPAEGATACGADGTQLWKWPFFSASSRVAAVMMIRHINAQNAP